MREDNASPGLTLVEVLVVIGIISITAAFAIPNYSGIRDKAAVNAASRGLSADLSLARVEAIKTGVEHLLAFNATVNGKIYDYVLCKGDGNGNCLAGGVVKSCLFSRDHPGVFRSDTDGPDTVRFDQRGFPVNVNGTISLEKHSRRKEVSITALGGIRID